MHGPDFLIQGETVPMTMTMARKSGPMMFAAAAFAGMTAILALPACTPAPAKSQTSEAPRGKLPDIATPTAYRIDLVIDPALDRFKGKAVIDITLNKASDRIWLHGLDLNVSEITFELNGAVSPAKYEQKGPNGISIVTFGKSVPAGPVTLSVTYDAPFSDNTLEGIYRGAGEDRIYVASQMEPLGARRAIPSFDEPRFKTPFTVSVTAPAGQVVITNGAETATEKLPDGMVRHVFATTEPLPSYLLAFAVGPYDVVEFPGGIAANELRVAAIPMRGAAAKGKGPQLAVALSETGKIVDYQERYFGVPYAYGKLDLIASPAFAYGAMENAGAIMYRETRLLVPQNAAFAQRRAYLGTHSHELAHQWFGNYVTPAWWEDIWLNEAFATWFGNKTAAVTNPELEFARRTLDDALGAMAVDSLSGTRQVMNPVESDEEVEGVFDAITYRKGGGVLAMFERYMGEDKFRDGVRLHMKRYGNSVATSGQFFDSLAEGSGKPEAAEAFKSFVTQKYVPLVTAALDCADPKAPKLTLSQSVYKPLASPIKAQHNWKIPACISYAAKGGVKETCTLLDAPKAEIALEPGSCPAFVMPNAAGAGYYRFTLDEAGWNALIRAFDRLPATEQLVVLDSATAAFEAGGLSAPLFMSAIRAGAKARDWDVANRALDEFLGRPGQILEQDGSDAVRAELKRSFGPRAAALIGARALRPGDRLLRTALVNAMVINGDDAAFIRTLSTEAKAGDLGLMEKEPDLRRAIAAAGIKANNGMVPAALLTNVVSSRDQGLRVDALTGIASAVSAEGAKALFSALSEGKVAGGDLQAVHGALVANPAARNAYWDWFKANAPRIAETTPQARKGAVPGLVGGFCDAAIVPDADAFFRKTAVKSDGTPLFPGSERALQLGIEQVELCAALQGAKAAELKAAITGNKG